jgi:hypothetical protein
LRRDPVKEVGGEGGTVRKIEKFGGSFEDKTLSVSQ